jgi:cysteinyl-tRNA synthetase
MLQAHYRSTLDFSNEALQAAEKGLQRLMNAVNLLPSLKTSAQTSINMAALKNNVYQALNDDFNTPIAIAALFEIVRNINLINDGKEKITEIDKIELTRFINTMVFDVLGLKTEQSALSGKVDGLMQLILEQRNAAKARKDYAASDEIRNKLKALGFEIKDSKEGTTYTILN